MKLRIFIRVKQKYVWQTSTVGSLLHPSPQQMKMIQEKFNFKSTELQLLIGNHAGLVNTAIVVADERTEELINSLTAKFQAIHLP